MVDRVVSCLILGDILMRGISQGLEDYLNGEWNILDFVMIWLSFLCSMVLESHVLSGLFKIVRLFRAFPLLKLVFQSECLKL